MLPAPAVPGIRMAAAAGDDLQLQAYRQQVATTLKTLAMLPNQQLQCLCCACVRADQLFKPMFVLAGDSITEFGFVDGGWGIMLAETYRRKADVINRGFGGYTSRMGVYILDEFLNSFGSGRIKLVTLCFGANDASHPTGIGCAGDFELVVKRVSPSACCKQHSTAAAALHSVGYILHGFHRQNRHKAWASGGKQHSSSNSLAWH